MGYHFRNVLSLFYVALFWATIFNSSPVAGGTIKRESERSRSLTPRQYALPNPPPDPAPKPGDGSASGTYCTIAAGAQDYATVVLCQGLVDLANALQYTNAASFLQHYLDATGTDLSFEVEDMIRDLPNFAAAVQTLVQNNAKTPSNKAAAAAPGSSFPFQSAWKLYSVSLTENPNWYAAIGSFSYSVTGVVTKVSKNQTALAYVVDVFDRYNWESGKKFTLNVVTLLSDPIGHLNQACLAQAYNVRASTVQNVVNPYDPSQPLPPITK